MALFDWLGQDIAGNQPPEAIYGGQPAVAPTWGLNDQGMTIQTSPYVPPTQAMTGPVGVVQPTATRRGKGASGMTYGDVMRSLMGSGSSKQPSTFLPQSPELGRAGGNVDPSAMQQGQSVFQQLSQPQRQGGGSGNMILGLLEKYFTGMAGGG
jgi:hypothetical protein